MAISINWATKIISVPRADLTLIQSTPMEIRELNLNTFRMWLKNEEDSEEGMTFPDTHRHNTEVSLGGLTFARVIEMINGYTVTFEDGQYAVNLVGANSNVGDVVNVNQVSVRSYNSAGLISNPAIEYASFNGGVSIDVTSPYSGTLYPVGTPQQPVNNLADALLIANVRGFTTFFIIGDVTIGDSGDYTGIIFIGESMTKTQVIVNASANVTKAEFYDCEIIGTLDGEALLKNCRIGDLYYINGVVEQCLLEEGTITLAGGADAHFLDCWSGAAGTANLPSIDMGSSGQSLAMRNFAGSIAIKNKHGNDRVTITLSAGQVTLMSSVDDGVVKVSGIGTVVDNSIGTAAVDLEDLVSPASISEAVWSSVDAQLLVGVIKNKKVLEKQGSTWYLLVKDIAGTADILKKALKAKDGSDITDIQAGIMAQELESSV